MGVGHGTHFIHGALSYDIVGCAMAVHRELGPGQEETMYHLAFCEALRQKGLKFESRRRAVLFHRGIEVDRFEADVVVEDTIVTELKALEGAFAPAHYTQLICYLKFWKKELGILFDFGKESLVQKRVPFTEHPPVTNLDRIADVLANLTPEQQATAAEVLDVFRTVNEEHGLGYREKTYQGLVQTELMGRGIPFVSNPTTALSFSGHPLGKSELPCFVVEGRCGVKVYALYDRFHSHQRATLQAYIGHLSLPFGVLANFGKHNLQLALVIPKRGRREP